MNRFAAPCILLMAATWGTLTTTSADPLIVSGNRVHDTIIGSWVYSDKRGDNSLTFSADGTFHGALSRGGKVVWSYAGTWTVTDDEITYVYTRSDPELVPVGMIDIDAVLNLTENCFTLESVSTELSRVCRAH